VFGWLATESLIVDGANPAGCLVGCVLVYTFSM
jgi:hypothetical protein